ncbi:HECT-domain-containing protein-like protein [Halenospora varia]|nr:HECT-domain-containing protein-like protein [Halenospora varia]
MTRDVPALHDGRDFASEEEVYAALWNTAPFPRLPEDAPSQIKDFVVELEDPKRVYAIHRAARRHQFQLLVERYIHQIRYGCKVKTCNTTTCFSCRKRLAGGAPVRRYNATSARTLAIYIASQDNPEQGLCHHPLADRPAPKQTRPLTVRTNFSNREVPSREVPYGSADIRSRNSPKEISPKETSSMASHETSLEQAQIERLNAQRQENRNKSTRQESRPRAEPRPILQETTTTDHRSFVQNVFGSVAFKMVEWLTPRSLEAMSRPDGAATEPSTREPITRPLPSPKSESISPPNPNAQPEEKREDVTDAAVKSEAIPKSTPAKVDSKPPRSKPSHASHASETKSQPISESKPITNSVTSRTTKVHGRKRSESMEPPGPKGILNLHSRTSETTQNVMEIPQYRPAHSKRRMSQQAVNSNTQVKVTDFDVHTAPNGVVAKPVSSVEHTSIPAQKEISPTEANSEKKPKERPRTAEEDNAEKEKASAKDVCKPQSLPGLPIDLINLLCDILQFDGTAEKHDFHPAQVGKELQKWLHEPNQFLKRNHNIIKEDWSYPSWAKEQWRGIIEQSIFDVLSNPDSLIRSFSDEKRQLYDTQTLWYVMLRLTRVAPSVVFDSLWVVAGVLFKPPERLDALHDWTKGDSSHSGTAKPLTNIQAAKVMNICLHALVAAAPLVTDARQLANMSRIRSYGLAMLGRETSSLEPIKLCLQYEDAFTNDLALRLARRLFASIPTRRRFANLMELQTDVKIDEKSEPDVLEGVLATLKFLDLDTTPALKFQDQDRDLHEKRVPTLLLDWARTVMLQDWDGSAEVASDGSFGGALAMMASIYKHRKSLLLGDIHFRTEYFAERLDPVGMPLEWLAFEQNKRTLHLLDHPYLFNPSTLVTYFRAINYAKMNQAYESAKASSGLMLSTMSEHQLMTNRKSREALEHRLRIANTRFMVLEISRKNVLTDTFNSIWRREERELMRPLKVRLGEGGGEEGLDSGGVQQEFFRLAIAEALDADCDAFTIDSRTKMAWFQPGSPEPLWKFELIGMIISLAVYNGLTLPVTFPKALYRKLVDQEVTELHHIADGWPDLANGLTSLLEWDEKEGLVEDVFTRTYEFSIEQFGGQPLSCEMSKDAQWPQWSDASSSSNPTDAPMVTNENRNNYVSDYIRWLTDVSVRPQFSAFKKGFFSCIDRRSLNLFDPETLQSVVEGVQEIDISEMRRAARYIGWDASHKTIKDFWSIVRKFDLEQKRRLLEFVTASDRVPVGGMRNIQFTLQRNGVDDGHLPSSYTCYGILLLPEYSSREVLREKLAMALENSKGFGFA